MRTRNAYDSAVVFLYATGRERLLPVKFRRTIPYATIAGWRQTDYSKYIGHEFRRYFDHAFDNLELNAEFYKAKQSLWSTARSWFYLRSLIAPLIKTAGNDKSTQKKVLDAVSTLQKSMGLKRVLKLFGLSHTLYRQWAIESQFDCFDSYTALCAKRHPHQLAKEEVAKIKRMLTESESDHWPIVSVASYGLRTGRMVASLYSWYKYARLLGITKKATGKIRKTVGLIATTPNEYWHVDTTFYPLMNGKEICIAIVMDNYSKMILGFHVMEKRTFAVVKEALRQAVKVACSHPGEKRTKLVADGGSENHNTNIHEFIKGLTGFEITKLRALKDIRFSNSPVEAINRTMKGRYLRGRKFESIKALTHFLNWAVHDYNELRPHYRHRPRTPHEVYFDIPLKFDVEKRKKKARAERLRVNKCSACIQCSGRHAGKNCKKH